MYIQCHVCCSQTQKAAQLVGFFRERRVQMNPAFMRNLLYALVEKKDMESFWKLYRLTNKLRFPDVDIITHCYCLANQYDLPDAIKQVLLLLPPEF